MAQSSDLSFEEKHAVVQQWLSSVFTSHQPEYLINAQAVDVLYSAALEAKQDETKFRLVAQGYRQRAEEYKAEAGRQQALHNRLGITLEDLSTEARKALEDMVDLAIDLDLKDCSYTSFLLAVSDHRRKQKQVKKQHKAKRKMERQLELSQNASIKASFYHQTLEKLQEVKHQQEQVREERLQYTEFLKQKSQQYLGQINTIQAELSRAGYQPSLSHSALVSISQEIEDLRKQLGPLKEQIASFQNLPPDMNLARIKLEEAKRELALLEDELANKVDLTQAEK